MLLLKNHHHELHETKKLHKFLPCRKIEQIIAINNVDILLIISILITVHILTGYDTVSYSYRRRKSEHLKLLYVLLRTTEITCKLR